jgi:hypothetical protein
MTHLPQKREYRVRVSAKIKVMVRHSERTQRDCGCSNSLTHDVHPKGSGRRIVASVYYRGGSFRCSVPDIVVRGSGMGTPYFSGILKSVENGTLALAGAGVLSRTNF